jgi:hypothetical protein
VAAIIASLACAPASGTVEQADGAATDSATQDTRAVAGRPRPIAPPAAVDTPPVVRPPDTAAAANSSAAAPDSAASADSVERLPPLPLITGRSRRDSISLRAAMRAGRTNDAWPVAGPPARPGAILPHRRIVAYYGNPLSTAHGHSGRARRVADAGTRLDGEVSAWRAPIQPRRCSPRSTSSRWSRRPIAGRDGKYRAKMADTLIERVYGWDEAARCVMFLDLQVGLSTIQAEARASRSSLASRRPPRHRPGVLDARRRMPRQARRAGTTPPTSTGWSTTSPSIVTRHHLPPKVLVVHRFTQRMVRNADRIKRDPRVQVVIHMDGWGAPRLKRDTYDAYITREPVQFTGFKIFYKNDTRRGSSLMTPADLLTLTPVPLYIQYQ